MNKIAIQTILATIILVAGIFAFIPIQKAVSVHVTIKDDIVDQERVVSFRIQTNGAVTDVTLIPDTDVVITGSVTAIITAGTPTIAITDQDGNNIVTDDTTPAAGEILPVTAIGANDEGIEIDISAAATVDVVIYLDTHPEV